MSDRIRIEAGDCREVMKCLAGEGVRVDSIVTDPPYHLHSIVKRFGSAGAAPAQHGKDGAFSRASAGFMGHTWDGGDIAFQPETWRLCYDLMKPGAYIVAFSSSRTFGRMSVAIEDAGFITHPLLGWIFATGFPKATRLKIAEMDGFRYGGQALKPALEPIYMGQKPMEGTGTDNWLAHGCGALNIDASRIPIPEDDTSGYWSGDDGHNGPQARNVLGGGFGGGHKSGKGRWPANVSHDGSEEVLAAFAAFGERASKDAHGTGGKRHKQSSNVDFHQGCAYGTLPPGRNDTGTAARFFFSSKADAEDRWGSKHPTVKPVELIRWLARLVTPPGGTLLDPFAGSGTAGIAALAEGFSAILIEREAEYLADIRERLAHYSGGGRHSLASKNRNAKPRDTAPLFDGAA